MSNRHSITVSTRGDGFYVAFPYNPAVSEGLKSKTSAYWRPQDRAWKVQLSRVDELVSFVNQHGGTIDWGATSYEELADRANIAAGEVPIPKVRRRKGKGNKLAITFPYHPRVSVAAAGLLCASIEDTKAQGWHWAVPVSLASANKILQFIETFRCDVEEGIVQELATLAARATANYDKSWAAKPEGTATCYGNDQRHPYEYQEAAVEYLLANKAVIVGDAMGVGKTSVVISALGTIQSFPALVVVPKSAKFVWDEYELPVWMPDVSRQVLSGQKADGDLYADIVIVNYDILWFWKDKLKAYGFKTFIADESHALANPASKRTKAAVEICKGSPEFKWLMTGTVVTNRPTELIGQLETLDRLGELFVNPSTFKGRYFSDDGHHPNSKELSEALRSSCYIRRNRDDILAPIPMIRSYLPIDTTAPDIAEYRTAERDIIRYLTDKAAAVALELGVDPTAAAVSARMRASAGADIVRLSQLRKLAGKAKIAGTIAWLDQYMEEYPDEKVLLFGYHRENLQAYKDYYGCKIIQGGVSDVKRSEAIRGIQDGDDRIVCLQIRAAGTAITLSAASTCVFTEQDWSPMWLLQAEARAARLGQKRNVLVYYTIADGTLDYKIYSLLQSKYDSCLAVMDRHRDAANSEDSLMIESATQADILSLLSDR